MKKTCMICGKKGKVEKHHIDYRKKITLEVCKGCHIQLECVLRRFPREPLDKPVKVICHKCNHKWTFKGRNPYLVTCPSCMAKTKVKK